MQILFVVNQNDNWPLNIEGVQIVTSRAYLSDPQFSLMRRVRVFNLCKSYSYQSVGYYVSLLAEARGHKPFPDAYNLMSMQSQQVVRFISDDLDELIQKCLAPLKSSHFELSIYFGRNMAKRYDKLSLKLFNTLHAPLLRASFVKQKKWMLQKASPIASKDIPASHWPFVVKSAEDYFFRKRRAVHRKKPSRFDLAILLAPDEKQPPSNERAIKKFINAAVSLDLGIEVVRKEDYGRLAEFDGLFIRETTSVNHHTYNFARGAAAEGLVVIDDPESIMKCTNKVFLAELLQRHKISIPKTMIAHRDNLAQVSATLGLPCILKQPDSSFSQGVMKVETEDELQRNIKKLLVRSEMIIAQQFLPTDFDWRIGILDKKPLFACRYFMARGHWQIIDYGKTGKIREGNADAVSIEDIPEPVLNTALKAANLIGDGLYGVDLKQIGKKVYVIEVNDNPNIDAGMEDKILKDELYLTVMQSFVRRIEDKKLPGKK
jgi:glutathione synthase/RimK-type ligase-like ATP-grasp enzyme